MKREQRAHTGGLPSSLNTRYGAADGAPNTTGGTATGSNNNTGGNYLQQHQQQTGTTGAMSLSPRSPRKHVTPTPSPSLPTVSSSTFASSAPSPGGSGSPNSLRSHRRAASMFTPDASMLVGSELPSTSASFTPSPISATSALLLAGTTSPDATSPNLRQSDGGLADQSDPALRSQARPQQRMVEVCLEQVSDHQFLSLLKMKFKKTRRQELELKELQRRFVSEEEERRRLAEENAVLSRRLEEERRLREAADSLASALREDNQRLNAQIEELNLRLVEIISNVSHMGVPAAEKAKVLKKSTKHDSTHP